MKYLITALVLSTSIALGACQFDKTAVEPTKESPTVTEVPNPEAPVTPSEVSK